MAAVFVPYLETMKKLKDNFVTTTSTVVTFLLRLTGISKLERTTLVRILSVEKDALDESQRRCNEATEENMLGNVTFQQDFMDITASLRQFQQASSSAEELEAETSDKPTTPLVLSLDEPTAPPIASSIFLGYVCWSTTIPTSPSVFSSFSSLSVVILHGYGGGIGAYGDMSGYLARVFPRCKVYCFDWLGCGRSARVPVPVGDVDKTIDYFLDSFEAWRDAMKLEKMILVGHSLGGYLSVAYTQKHPTLVHSLHLISPIGLPEAPPLSTFSRIRKNLSPPKKCFAYILSALFRSAWKNGYTPFSLFRLLGSNAMGILRKGFERRLKSSNNVHVSEAFIKYLFYSNLLSRCSDKAITTLLRHDAFARKPLGNVIKALNVPVCFYYGQSDWVSSETAENLVLENSAMCKLEFISSSGHLVNVENPKEFAIKAAGFVASMADYKKW
ncbi:putative Abhydrolase domain-containing protein 4 [Cardiosporidium cionae]|uniref:Abhydrolase domain-containing protein 4 n=1 Tax=Cardiosporidium cionae TaxID=476202 RepID=A0ABQ7J929_9APIC|nr:putative Abhydrolase domain-containing protein 4 [Cardiosporidium cionae]|eukprot:KAF8820487.1 putative Abhydrolase domain-containing protein 4 [Cardiosporidium cionae]